MNVGRTPTAIMQQPSTSTSKEGEQQHQGQRDDGVEGGAGAGMIMHWAHTVNLPMSRFRPDPSPSAKERVIWCADGILRGAYLLEKSPGAENTHATVVNRGTGAGGANTNYHGKRFEEKTDNRPRLMAEGYVKTNLPTSATKSKKTLGTRVYDHCLVKTHEDPRSTTTFVSQSGLKAYMKHTYGIPLFRCPDEAYITTFADGRRTVVKILEKKEQNVSGSVETKLWSGPSLKREYELVLGPEFEVVYGFCVSDYLKTRMVSADAKYQLLNTILGENRIAALFGDDADYFESLDAWLRK
jgi:hypothetical protein